MRAAAVRHLAALDPWHFFLRWILVTFAFSSFKRRSRVNRTVFLGLRSRHSTRKSAQRQLRSQVIFGVRWTLLNECVSEICISYVFNSDRKQAMSLSQNRTFSNAREQASELPASCPNVTDSVYQSGSNGRVRCLRLLGPVYLLLRLFKPWVYPSQLGIPMRRMAWMMKGLASAAWSKSMAFFPNA